MNEHLAKRRRIAGAIGAIAAGVGGAVPSQAAVVHQNVSVAVPPDFNVDINGDTIREFVINHHIDEAANDALVKVTDFATGVAVLRDGVNSHTSNLAAGTPIGPASGVYSNTGPDQLTGVVGGVPMGNFQVSDDPGYIGVQFPIGANIHYGYVGYEGTGAENSPNGRVFSLGYETIPGAAIAAGAIPEPSSLALLAAGAVGVSAYRRRRTG
jgi:hypothetical protein